MMSLQGMAYEGFFSVFLSFNLAELNWPKERFQMCSVDFRREITEKGLKLKEKVENGRKRLVQPAFGCAQHPKAGRNAKQATFLF